MTERVGALSDRFLGRARPLGEARLLWEIGLDGADVRELRGRLELDSGYVSRLLRSLERQRLVDVASSRDDGRVRRAFLTEDGVAEWEELDRRSDELAHSLLERLSESQRARLGAAMAEVERLLIASMVSVAVEDAASRDARWCIEQYYRELDDRFDTGFDPARSIPADSHELTPPAGLMLIARLRRQAVGCGALKLHPDRTAELKRMWIAPQMRGLGLGRRLLGELEGAALRSGIQVIRLETNRTLIEAIALYRRCGYREVEAFNAEPYAHHWFEKDLA